jgi:hypothetical protein
MALLDETRGPLPGNAVNNCRFAVEYMRRHGFEVKEDTLSEYPQKRMYYLRGELVGWSYETVMYLQPVMPSLIQMGILAHRRKTEIGFDQPAIELHKRLKDTVNELKSSSESYEDLLKSYRVQKVKRYFRYRFIAKQLAKALHEESRSSV